MLIFLLPPSEWKNTGWIESISSRTFDFELPLDIAVQATPKDLKCKWERYKEGIQLNKNTHNAKLLPAIHRYSGVMYKAIGYDTLDLDTRQYFDNHVLILSGMYGLLSPQDTIANYKLPIDTKWLRQRRWDRLTQAIIDRYAEQDVTLVDLLSWAYQKMLNPEKIRQAWIVYQTVVFLKPDGSKYTHGVKKVKGERLRDRIVNLRMRLESQISEKATLFNKEVSGNYEVIIEA